MKLILLFLLPGLALITARRPIALGLIVLNVLVHLQFAHFLQLRWTATVLQGLPLFKIHVFVHSLGTISMELLVFRAGLIVFHVLMELLVLFVWMLMHRLEVMDALAMMGIMLMDF
jgi:hypothetical protein